MSEVASKKAPASTGIEYKTMMAVIVKEIKSKSVMERMYGKRRR